TTISHSKRASAMPAAFKATFSDLKNIKTRQVVQLVFEVPLADFDQAYEVLGGLPDPAKERWFGIAAIRGEEVVGARSEHTAGTQDREQSPGSKWRVLGLPQQAGIRCNDIAFRVFLDEEYPEEWRESRTDPAECVRLICGVTSRSDLANEPAQSKWKHL